MNTLELICIAGVKALCHIFIVFTSRLACIEDIIGNSYGLFLVMILSACCLTVIAIFQVVRFVLEKRGD